MIKYIDEGILHQAEEKYYNATQGMKIPVRFADQEFLAHIFLHDTNTIIA
jgi:hypothetical protein